MSHEQGCAPSLTPKDIPPVGETSILRISTRTAIILLWYCVAFTALMAATFFATKPAIEASAQAEKLKMIDAVLPRDSYDNELLKDTIPLKPTEALGLDDTTTLYRARKAGEPVAIVFEAVAPDGYSGKIRLILAVKANGELSAVRVIEHKETPGLGDYIDPKKDRNKSRPWISQFNDLSFEKLPAAEFKVKKDGGRIDNMAGATISPRAVTNATHRALEWAVARREKLFAQPTGQALEE
ncbi:MAG TPA: electron transport complex subunit RsxG [Rhodocyclaceae bacterium]|nr:electron transport complex subunit RsxG [Rhodocyclaceae bacterium]